MRYACLAASAGFAFGFAPMAFALSVGDQTPQSFDQVQEAINQIQPDLETAQCGGWLDETVQGKISVVDGVPGRNHAWNGAILSGMGKRIDENGNGDINDDFIWPEETRGLGSSCWRDTRSETRTVWRQKTFGIVIDPNYPEIEQQQIAFPSPYFEDPMCRWRMEGGNDSPPIPLPENGEFQYAELDEEPQDRQSPPVCRGFCLYLNRFVYLDCLSVQEAYTPTEPPVPYLICAQWGHRYLCSEEPAPDYGLTDLRDPDQLSQWIQQHEITNNQELCPQEILDAEPDTMPPPSEIMSNSRSCQGEGCRCYGPGCFFTNNGRFFWSYFRRYFGSYARDEVVTNDGGNDRSTNEAPVACYGGYDEFDPLTRQTIYADRRCVINIDVSEYRTTQAGKGEFGQNSNLPDRDPAQPQNQRKNGAFNQEEDLWYEKLSGGFSLLNETVFEEDFEQDLTNVFLNIDELDKAQMRATEQLDAQRPLAKSNTIRAFDDTGEGRIVASWWQKQQNEMAAALHPAAVRILLPAGWAFGIDPEDPFFQTKAKVVTDGQTERGERIEVQIDAEEDILGSALGYIERSLLLNIEEEPVPVLIPMGSPTEFRALAEQWCTWYMTQFGESDCEGAPSDVRGLMLQLEKYADEIDNARMLRAELARYAGKILELQQSITAPIGLWVKANIDQYKSVLQEQQQLRSQLAAQWRQTQEVFNNFSNRTNLPWCMNQRYTSPIYSLLDEWLPSRTANGQISADSLPNLTAPPQEDVIIDFSTIVYMSGSIVLPVLKPVQVRITDLPVPPPGREYAIESLPPPLPSIDLIRDYIQRAAQNLPKPPENMKQPPPISMQPMGQEAVIEMGSTIDMISQLVIFMDYRYSRFWKSISPLTPDEPDEGRNSIKRMKEELECYNWDSDTCQHVEMDLLERFVRIGSRPLVMLNEDYDSLGALRSFGGPCVPEDHVCTPMHPESSLPKTQWDIVGPQKQPDFIDNLRRNIRNETLPEPVGGLSSSAMPTYDTNVNHLLPIHDVPEKIDLTPPASSSSSSSSS